MPGMYHGSFGGCQVRIALSFADFLTRLISKRKELSNLDDLDVQISEFLADLFQEEEDGLASVLTEHQLYQLYWSTIYEVTS